MNEAKTFRGQGTIQVTMQYAGRGKPSPIDEEEDFISMKVGDALICCSCDSVISFEDLKDGGCPCCTSRAFFPLARVIQPLQDAKEIAIVRIMNKASE